MRIRIDEIMRKDYTSRKGQLFTKIWVKSGEDWYSAFLSHWNKHWEKGMVIEDPNIAEDRVGDTVYKNILPPKSAAAHPSSPSLTERVSILEEKVSRLENGN